MVILREQKNIVKEIEESGLKKASLNLVEIWKADIGVAADIGTTTIAVTVVDFRNGELLGQLSEINEQTKLGADVMMRIMHAVAGKAAVLQQMVVSQIERMTESILKEKLAEGMQMKHSSICFSVVGNTTMCHLFLGKSVAGLAGYPFKPAYTGNYECNGSEIGMKHFAGARVIVLSGIAAHVGSDALAVIGAEQIYQKDKVQLAIDLGTNAEIILNNRGKLSVCSAAAGPAFEGKGISCGMSAAPGAVTGVKISLGNGNIILEYRKGREVKGICGSGLVDLLAELRRCRVLQEDGYLLSSEEARQRGIHPEICRLLVEREKQHAFLLYHNTKNKKEIYILQNDIRSAQLAKGAIQAGIHTLCQESGVNLSEINEVFVAGVLGSCMNPSNAIQIGLLPQINAVMRFVGNAAGKGGLFLLTEKNFSTEMEQLAKEIVHVELANLEEFQTLFFQTLNLSRWGENR